MLLSLPQLLLTKNISVALSNINIILLNHSLNFRKTFKTALIKQIYCFENLFILIKLKKF